MANWVIAGKEMFAGGGFSRTLVLMFLATAIFGCGNVTRSDRVAMVGVLPGGAAIFPHMSTFRDQRFVHVVRQEHDFSCGAAALATILKYAYGMDVTENGVFRAMYAVSNQTLVRERGFSLLDLSRYLATIGMRGAGYRIPPEALYQIKVPVIVLLNIGGYEHFVVMRRAVKGRGVYVADPALGNRRVSRQVFLKEWQFDVIFAVIGKKYDPENPLVTLKTPLGSPQVTRNLMPAFNPLTEQMLSGIAVFTGPRL
ncbi:MAG: C39 family peptidase [Candidatus Binataceae bacterium]